MKASLSWAIVATLGACSQVPDSPYVGPNQPRVVADGNSVTVVNVRSEAEAEPWASGYCAKRSRVAHFLGLELYKSERHQPTNSTSFACIPR